MKNLSDAFGLKFELNDRLLQIRLLLNASIGHPTKNRTKGITYFNYISRPSLDKNGFTLIKSFDQGNKEYHDIEFLSIVNDQLFEIELGYESLCKKLSKVDKLHRLKFKDNPLSDIFDSSMDYLFEKVVLGVYSSQDSDFDFGLSMLKIIQEKYNKF